MVFDCFDSRYFFWLLSTSVNLCYHVLRRVHPTICSLRITTIYIFYHVLRHVFAVAFSISSYGFHCIFCRLLSLSWLFICAWLFYSFILFLWHPLLWLVKMLLLSFGLVQLWLFKMFRLLWLVKMFGILWLVKFI